ncbi:MAG: DUF1361 domain-containing protein [Candidatus Viridilinea halotolerans]|uniref:DUF1361 domain-containing protein n=1 Tax=Candidatus Viridilinea halotolerans TaxID=2491704 RepID=A0A426U7U7_9CHLR|nr:MAG: DUF1361 domain-containing protein [Candidatus Viridilinea halotolerans]
MQIWHHEMQEDELLTSEDTMNFFKSTGARLFIPCFASSSLAVGMLVGRNLMGHQGYIFLIWNLFLAWLPYLATLWMAWAAQRSRINFWLTIVPVGSLWLLFLPNAPYLLTDLIHFRGMHFVWWYDSSMLFSFAWAGIMLGVASLYIIGELSTARYGWLVGWGVVLATVSLSGLGVYVGRFLRWNSWDAIMRPRIILHDLVNLFSDPSTYPRLLGVSGLIACVMLVGYLTIISIQGERERMCS